MPTDYAVVQAKLAAIEAEMKRSGFWQNTPLKPEQYQFEQAVPEASELTRLLAEFDACSADRTSEARRPLN
jgi:hypothetical protein